MPTELKSKDDFQKMAQKATEIRVVKDGENAKVKVRTGRRLYTFKATAEEVDSLTKGLKVPVVEY